MRVPEPPRRPHSPSGHYAPSAETQSLTIGLIASVSHHLDSFFVEIVKRWEARGHRVVVAAGDSSDNFPQMTVMPAITRNPNFRNFRAFRPLRRWVDDNAIDVVITNTATSSTLVRAAHVNAPIIYFCHGLHWNGRWPNGLPYRILERALLKRTDGIVCLNSHDEMWFEANAPDIPRLRLKHGVGVDLQRYRRLAYNPWHTDEPLRLVWCGELTKRKNPVAALALANELTRRGIKFELAMLGIGPLASSRDFQSALGESVHIVGFTDPVPYFERAHALIQTSRWEGLPRVALEALAIGLPTIGYDVKGVRDIPGAYLTQEDDIQGLAEATREAALNGPVDLPRPLDLSVEHAADSLLCFSHRVLASATA